MPENAAIPNDVPSHKEYSGTLMLKLLSSRVAMLLRM